LRKKEKNTSKSTDIKVKEGPKKKGVWEDRIALVSTETVEENGGESVKSKLKMA